MDDDDGCALDALLMFQYTGNYTTRSFSARTPNPHENIRGLLLVKYHCEVGLLADKYDLPDLKELASLRAKHVAAEYLPAAQA